MKVALVSKSFKPNVGGIEIVVEQLQNALIEKNIDAFVLTQTKQNNKNEKIISMNFLNCFSKLKKLSPDIIHIHGFRSISIPVAAAAKILKIPVIITPHFDYDSNFKNKLNIFVHKKSSFKKIIALTEFEKNKLIELGFHNIEVIPNFFDYALLDVSAREFRKTFQIPQDSFLFLFAGRLASNKGIPYLIEAFSKLEFEKKFLAVIGKQDKRFKDTTFDYYNSLAEKFGVKNKVVFTGRINEFLLAQGFHECNAVVFPSIASEAFGLVLLQAMYCEKPVIASSLEPIKEIIKHKETGLLVEPRNADALAEAMQSLALNLELCQKLGVNGKKRAIEYYSKQQIVQKHIELYSSILEKKQI
ncbi:MAG: glycosyltransferase family 4 protein [archaeon]|nr:glycosyltransferase family 4 protein [archaeon]